MDAAAGRIMRTWQRTPRRISEVAEKQQTTDAAALPSRLAAHALRRRREHADVHPRRRNGRRTAIDNCRRNSVHRPDTATFRETSTGICCTCAIAAEFCLHPQWAWRPTARNRSDSRAVMRRLTSAPGRTAAAKQDTAAIAQSIIRLIRLARHVDRGHIEGIAGDAMRTTKRTSRTADSDRTSEAMITSQRDAIQSDNQFGLTAALW